MIFIRKSWICPALFFCLVFNPFFSFTIQAHLLDTLEPEYTYKIANSPTWLALLHIKENTPRISDPKFILSIDNFSPEKELIKTLELFEQQKELAYCRFPARHQYLSQYFDLSQFSIDEVNIQGKCNGFSTYQRKVPFNKLSLIYASEDLSSASSMMGHVFLKATGANDNQNVVAHSVSFFTEYDTYNPFELIYDGLINGMSGFFMVRPYQNDLIRYSEKEKRNVFEYDLELTQFAKKLIQLHIWELKDTNINYLFQSYNCATLTLYVLSIGEPHLKQAEKLFVSPADVVKAADENRLIKNVSVTLSKKWKYYLLKQQLGRNLSEQVEQLFLRPIDVSFLDEYSRTQQILAIRYLQLLMNDTYFRSILSEANKELLKNVLKQKQFDDEQQRIEIDFKSYSNPLNAQQDSIITASYLQYTNTNFVELSFLPASHYFRARNKQFFAESQLKIGEIVLRLNTDSMRLDINNLTLYSVTSLVPSESLQSELSGNFYLGYKQFYADDLSETGIVTLEGGLGRTIKLHQDIMIFGMLNVGASVNFDEQFIFVSPKVGILMNLAFDTKFMASHEYKNHRLLEDGVNFSSVELSWAGAKKYSFSLSIESAKTRSRRSNILNFSIDYHF